MKLSIRNMEFARTSVSSWRNAAFVPEVGHALAKWVKAKTGAVAPGILIGGLAMSFYAKPRYTEDIDLLFLEDHEVPKEVEGFKKHRLSAFEDREDNVEVELVTATSIGIPQVVARKVIETAVEYDGIRVASLEAMVVLKLYGSDNPRRLHHDMADVDRILENHPNVDLSGWLLTPKQKARFVESYHRMT